MDTATINNPPGRKEAGAATADRRLRIYICSPYRPRMESAEQAKRELADNIDRAKTACRLVAELGAIPICSHLFCTQFLDDSIVSEREQGRRIGLEMLKDADELWCFSEYISEGMVAEIQEASRLGLPVRMFCETTGLLGKVMKQVVRDLHSGMESQDGH